MTKYTKATLHSNGETQEFSTPEDAKRLRAAFDAFYFKSSDGTKEFGVTSSASTFVVLEIGTPDPLGPKPQCNNYCACCSSCSDSGSDSDSTSDSQSDSTTDSDSVSDSESEA